MTKALIGPPGALREIARHLHNALLALNDHPDIEALQAKAEEGLHPLLLRDPDEYSDLLREFPHLQTRENAAELLDMLDCLRYLAANNKVIATGLAALIKLSEDRRTVRPASANAVFDSILRSYVPAGSSAELLDELLRTLAEAVQLTLRLPEDKAREMVTFSGVWEELPRLLSAMLVISMQPEAARDEQFQWYCSGLWEATIRMGQECARSWRVILRAIRDALLHVFGHVSELYERTLSPAFELIVEHINALERPEDFEPKSVTMLMQNGVQNFAALVQLRRRGGNAPGVQPVRTEPEVAPPPRALTATGSPYIYIRDAAISDLRQLRNLLAAQLQSMAALPDARSRSLDHISGIYLGPIGYA